MHRVVLLLLFAKCILGSFPFDLSKIIPPKGPKIIYTDTKRVVREFGAKRPLEVTDENDPDYGNAEKFTVTSPLEIVPPQPAKKPLLEIVPDKRKFSKITPNMTPEEIIKNEISHITKLTGKRADVFKTTIKFIIENDLKGYLAHQQEFKEIFKKSYSQFARNGIRNYILTFAIIFGAHDIVPNYVISKFCDYNNDLEFDFPHLFKYLFSTKPFDICMKTAVYFSAFEPKVRQDIKQELTTIVEARFPDLDYFNRLLFEIFFAGSSTPKMAEMFDRISDLEKAELIAELSSGYYLCNDGKKIIQRFPLQKTELYLQLDEEHRFKFIECAIRLDDDDLLSEILEIDPEIAALTIKKTGPTFYRQEFSSAFIIAVDCKAYKCFELLAELFKDALNQENIDSIEAAFCPVRLAIQSAESKLSDDMRYKFIEILESIGLTMDITFPRTELNGLILDIPHTMLQYSLFTKNSYATEYFFRRTDPKRAREEIYRIWKSDNELVKHLITNIKENVTKLIADTFGIDLNANVFVNDQGKKGNISVFLPADRKAERARILNVNLPFSRLNR